MRLFALSFVTVLISCQIGAAQIPASEFFPKVECKLTLRNAPALRGLKLGMSSKEVSTLLGIEVTPRDYKTTGSFKFKVPDREVFEEVKEGVSIGVKSWNWTTKKLDTPHLESEPLRDLLRISFDFLENHLYSIDIVYVAQSYTDKPLTYAVADFSLLLDLPTDSWTYSGLQMARMDCIDFKIRMFLHHDKDLKRTFLSMMLEDTNLSSRVRQLADQAVKDAYLKDPDAFWNRKKVEVRKRIKP